MFLFSLIKIYCNVYHQIRNRLKFWLQIKYDLYHTKKIGMHSFSAFEVEIY